MPVDENNYSPKCSNNDITKMLDLPGQRSRKEFPTIHSKVARTWSAKGLSTTKGDS